MESNQLDPTVFDGAASYIETNGWWGGEAVDNEKPPAGTLPCACISNAVAAVAGSGCAGAPYQSALRQYLNCATMDELFRRNDSYDAVDGPLWAVSVLRAMAEALRTDGS